MCSMAISHPPRGRLVTAKKKTNTMPAGEDPRAGRPGIKTTATANQHLCPGSPRLPPKRTYQRSIRDRAAAARSAALAAGSTCLLAGPFVRGSLDVCSSPAFAGDLTLLLGIH